MDNGKGSGSGAALIIILGIAAAILFITGLFGSVTGVAGTLLKIFGLICIIVAALLVALIVAVIIIALNGRKTDPNAEEKSDTRELINTKEQEIAKVKSNIAVKKMELRRAEAEQDAALTAQLTELITELTAREDALQAEVLSMKTRRDAALAKLHEADTIKAEENGVLKYLEEKAQYEKDYADALKQLGGR